MSDVILSFVGRVIMKVLENKQLHHLGIVAGVCNEIGLIETIDRHVLKPKRKVSVGQAVQAMIVNALGFSGRCRASNCFDLYRG